MREQNMNKPEVRQEVNHRTLEHVRQITEKQLDEAVKRQVQSGKTLWEILISDLSLGSIKDLLSYEIGSQRRPLKEVMLESGLATEAELGELLARENKQGLRFGEVMIDKGLISRAQLGKALIEQERTGHPLGRVLMNMGLVNAKELTDAMRLDTPVVTPKLRREQVVEAVLKDGNIDRQALLDLAKESEEGGRDLAELLVEKGGLSAAELGRMMERELGIPYVSLTNCSIADDVLAIIPEAMVRSRHLLPLNRDGSRLRVAMSDPNDVSAIDDLAMITGCQISPVLVWEKPLQAAITKYFGEKSEGPVQKRTPAPELHEPQDQATARPAKDQRRFDELVENVSVVNLVASIIEGAINAEATDIHLEPQENNLRVRYRIDGMLYDVMAIPRNVELGLVSRIKILGKMDITQKRMSQDGHFSMELKGKAYDMRIATLPTSLGERVVIRLLNPGNVLMGLKQLGFSSADYTKMESLIYSPHGMILVSGPMGSGKTTTLYATLNQINVLTDSIVTIEDPVEYQLPGISQVQVDLKINRTFANVLRAVLRQDANTLLVGEIRDDETAHIAVRAAVTGHLVFSTLHTRDAVGALVAMVNLGVPRFLLTSSLIGVVNQRLVRKICPHCIEEYTPGEALIRELKIENKIGPDTTFARGKGCGACYHTGYHGRSGIFEVLTMDERLKELVLKNASVDELQHQAVAGGMRTLYDDALEKLEKKITTPEEVLRTVHVER